MEFRDQRSSVGEDVARHVRMLCGRYAGQRIGQHRDGRHVCREGRPVRRNVDAESESAHDAKPRNPFRQPFDNPVAGRLPVGRRLARPHHRNAPRREGLDAAPDVDHVGIVGDFAQQRRIFRVGRGDGCNAVAAAVGELLFSRGKALPADDLLHQIGPQFRFAGQFAGGGREDAPRIAELLQQMHGAFRTDARSHLKGNILDGHGREWNDVFFDG